MRGPQNECWGLNIHHHPCSLWREQWSLFPENTNIHQIVHTIPGASQHLPKHTDNSSRSAWMSGLRTSHLNTDPWGAVIVKGCLLFIIPERNCHFDLQRSKGIVYMPGLPLVSTWLGVSSSRSARFIVSPSFILCSSSNSPHTPRPHLIFGSYRSFLSLCLRLFLKNYLLSSYTLHLTSPVFIVQIYQALTVGRHANCFTYFKLENLHSNLIGKVVFALL